MKNDNVNFEGETEEENQEVQYQIIRVLGFLLILLKNLKHADPILFNQLMYEMHESGYIF